MVLFLGHDPADDIHEWPEWQIQSYIVQEARREGFDVTADMAAGKRNPGKAKASGLTAGQPDLMFWFPGARVVLIELKNSVGVLSKVQKDRHAILRGMGFAVYTVFASCPADGWEKIKEILKEFSL